MNAEQIRGAAGTATDLELTPVKVPEWAAGDWDGTIYIRELTLAARQEYVDVIRIDTGEVDSETGQKKYGTSDSLEMFAKLIQLTAADGGGALIWEGDDGLAWLMGRSGRVVERLAGQAGDHCGLAMGDDEAAQELGKSETTPESDSSTDSPDTLAPLLTS